jgi:NAD(P)-dependent dehydrogenase (short-subunit alcohol dehydrogenase family)
LGRAYVLRLARLGADVVVNDINLESHRVFDEKLTAPTVMEEVEALGRRSLGIQADVKNKTEVDAMFETIIDEFDKIDVLVNNAGGILKRPGAPPDAPMNATDVSEEDFLFQFKINFWGTVLCSQRAATYMKEQRSGKIVNIASQAGLRTTVSGGQMPYSIAKAAIIHYTRILAAELGEYNINVNCIAPAFILTSKTIAWGRNEPETRKPLESQIALARLGLPEDCAKVIEFLVTDLSDYVTGQCIPAGGGYVLF